jgi:hypothetical protein
MFRNSAVYSLGVVSTPLNSPWLDFSSPIRCLSPNIYKFFANFSSDTVFVHIAVYRSSKNHFFRTNYPWGSTPKYMWIEKHANLIFDMLFPHNMNNLLVILNQIFGFWHIFRACSLLKSSRRLFAAPIIIFCRLSRKMFCMTFNLKVGVFSAIQYSYGAAAN